MYAEPLYIQAVLSTDICDCPAESARVAIRRCGTTELQSGISGAAHLGGTVWALTCRPRLAT
jgi:hypothetical protein